MEIDSKQLLTICKQLGLQVDISTCGKFTKRLLQHSQKRAKQEFLTRIAEQLKGLLTITASAKNQPWQATNKYDTTFEFDGGITHASTGGMFSIIHKMAEKFLDKVNSILNKESINTVVGIEYDGLHFNSVELKLIDMQIFESSENIILPNLSKKTGKKIKDSDEIMHLFSFWLENKGEVNFSAGSSFTLFCSKILEKNHVDQDVKLDTLEKRFKSIGLSEKYGKLISKVPNENREIKII